MIPVRPNQREEKLQENGFQILLNGIQCHNNSIQVDTTMIRQYPHIKDNEKREPPAFMQTKVVSAPTHAEPNKLKMRPENLHYG